MLRLNVRRLVGRRVRRLVGGDSMTSVDTSADASADASPAAFAESCADASADAGRQWQPQRV